MGLSGPQTWESEFWSPVDLCSTMWSPHGENLTRIARARAPDKVTAKCVKSTRPTVLNQNNNDHTIGIGVVNSNMTNSNNLKLASLLVALSTYSQRWSNQFRSRTTMGKEIPRAPECWTRERRKRTNSRGAGGLPGPAKKSRASSCFVLFSRVHSTEARTSTSRLLILRQVTGTSPFYFKCIPI